MKNGESVFDTIIDRRGSNCGKWDTMDAKYGKDDVIHLGVADMDFRAPQPILDGLKACVEHGILGYTDLNNEFYEAISGWMKRIHHINVEREEIVFCPRINISSGLCVETFTEAGDEVLINTPAYGPLYQSIVKNNRVPVDSPLVRHGDRYEINFAEMEKLVTKKTKMFILCSPHNPVSRVWSREELVQAGEFCIRHNLLLFVDEIHGDIVNEGVVFTSSLSLPEAIRNRLLQVSSPAKTFNIPGVILSYMIIPNADLRERVKMSIDRIGMHNPTVFAVSAMENAYTKCDDWYREMLSYINENEKLVRAYFEKYMRDFYILPRQGTYLLWMDYSALGCTEQELETWFIEEAKVSVYMGTVFREQGNGYIRVNIACPRALLEKALDRMYKVYDKKI